MVGCVVSHSRYLGTWLEITVIGRWDLSRCLLGICLSVSLLTHVLCIQGLDLLRQVINTSYVLQIASILLCTFACWGEIYQMRCIRWDASDEVHQVRCIRWDASDEMHKVRCIRFFADIFRNMHSFTYYQSFKKSQFHTHSPMFTGATISFAEFCSSDMPGSAGHWSQVYPVIVLDLLIPVWGRRVSPANVSLWPVLLWTILPLMTNMLWLRWYNWNIICRV